MIVNKLQYLQNQIYQIHPLDSREHIFSVYHNIVHIVNLCSY